MSTLSAYLAKNYLNASSDHDPSSTRPKKRRKKDKANTSLTEGTLLIADDEDLLLSGSSRAARGGEDDDDNSGLPMVYDGNVKSAEFRRKKGASSNWKTISGPDPSTTTGSTARANVSAAATAQPEADDEADAILASAAAASDARQREIEMDDAPAIVESPSYTAGPRRMESGALAGLQTAADTAAIAEREERARKAEEKEARRATKKKQGRAEEEIQEETVYRDATGRRIDVSMKRAEARAREVAKAKEEKRKREEAMGDVQRRMKEERKTELEDAKFLTLGRTVDDEDMNAQLKGVDRWGDPMAGYVTNKPTRNLTTSSKSGGDAATTRDGTTPRRKKTYAGHAAPNRYGIVPGWRWDGVDRGNGFEKDWFQARSRRTRNDDLAYQWQMDE